MTSDTNLPINQSIHESSDPEMLEREAQANSGDRANDIADNAPGEEVPQPAIEEKRHENQVAQQIDVAIPNVAATQPGLTNQPEE